MTLIVAGLGTAFTTDPAISLKNYLSNNWNGGFYFGTGSFIEGSGSFQGTTPHRDQIRFATKYDSLAGPYQIIVKNITNDINFTEVGPARRRHEDKKSVEVYARGHDGENRRWQLEERINQMISGNPTGLASDGVETMQISAFLPFQTADTPTKANSSLIYRSKAIVTLEYDKVIG